MEEGTFFVIGGVLAYLAEIKEVQKNKSYKNDATYLYADVEIVASWEVYNIKTVALENALHKLFKRVQLQLAAGIAHPKEWYIVPYNIIEEAVSRLVQGEKIGYDVNLQKIVGE